MLSRVGSAYGTARNWTPPDVYGDGVYNDVGVKVFAKTLKWRFYRSLHFFPLSYRVVPACTLVSPSQNNH
jgi:hypothetical protein